MHQSIVYSTCLESGTFESGGSRFKALWVVHLRITRCVLIREWRMTYRQTNWFFWILLNIWFQWSASYLCCYNCHTVTSYTYLTDIYQFIMSQWIVHSAYFESGWMSRFENHSSHTDSWVSELLMLEALRPNNKTELWRNRSAQFGELVRLIHRRERSHQECTLRWWRCW